MRHPDACQVSVAPYRYRFRRDERRLIFVSRGIQRPAARKARAVTIGDISLTVETQVTRDREWIVIRFTGPGTLAEVKAAYVCALEAAEAAGLSRIVIDSVDSVVHPRFDEMRDLAHFALSLRKSRLPKTALIVKGPLQFGLARMFASLVEFADWEFRIFRTMGEAESWLTAAGAENNPDPTI